MACEAEVYIPAQGSIYVEQEKRRELRVAYSIPEQGINAETGILCLIPAYGGNLESHVFKKMRREFPDKYNVAVLQCDYFGIQYMGECMEHKSQYFQALKSQGKYEGTVKTYPQESLQEYNDMGMMQAMDVITMVLWFVKKLIQEGAVFHTRKVIAYGSSHGSYLSYLANRLCPGLFTLLIDISAYLYPKYLEKDRKLTVIEEEKGEKYCITNHIRYLAMRQSQIRLPDEFYELEQLYENVQNQCCVISFHGEKDDMTSIEEKERFITTLGKKAELIPIIESAVDGIIFRDDGHDFGANFLTLYEAIEKTMQFEQGRNLVLPNAVTIEGEQDRVVITYEDLIPHVIWQERCGMPKEKKDDIEEWEKVSVIVPCYNVEDYIKNCVDSLLAQTIGLNHMEIILIDDASTDHTREILMEYQTKYPEQIRVIVNLENIRQGGARNRGMEAATGQYIGFVDADDWVEPNMYKTLLRGLKKNQCDMAMCTYTDEISYTGYMGDMGKHREQVYDAAECEEAYPFFLTERLPTTGIMTMLFRKEFLENTEIRFPEKIAYEDNYWGPLISLDLQRVCVIAYPYYHYRQNPNSTIHQKNAMHHLERLKIEEMKLQKLKEKGVLQTCHERVEASFMELFYLNTLHMMFINFEKMPDVYSKMKQTVLREFPNYEHNRILKKDAVAQKMLGWLKLEQDLTVEELEEFAEQYRTGKFV